MSSSESSIASSSDSSVFGEADFAASITPAIIRRAYHAAVQGRCAICRVYRKACLTGCMFKEQFPNNKDGLELATAVKETIGKQPFYRAVEAAGQHGNRALIMRSMATEAFLRFHDFEGGSILFYEKHLNNLYGDLQDALEGDGQGDGDQNGNGGDGVQNGNPENNDGVQNGNPVNNDGDDEIGAEDSDEEDSNDEIGAEDAGDESSSSSDE